MRIETRPRKIQEYKIDNIGYRLYRSSRVNSNGNSTFRNVNSDGSVNNNNANNTNGLAVGFYMMSEKVAKAKSVQYRKL